MPNVKHRRYYQYAEKETETISLKWKAIHAILFCLITINSFIATFAFQTILGMFNQRCILYAEPVFDLKEVQQYRDVPIDHNNVTEEAANSTEGSSRTFNATDIDDEYLDLKMAGESKVEIREDKYWFSNSTVNGMIAIDLWKTTYSSSVMCEMVVFNTMISLLLAVFFGVLVIICGRGGRGNRTDLLPQPWLYVYPVLIVSSIMVVVCTITANTVLSGLKHFCAHFHDFTGESTCTDLISNFAYYHGEFRNDFYEFYRVCLYSFNIAMILWALQVIITLLRILCVVDFQLNSVTIGCRHPEEETVHEVLVKSIPGLKADKSFVSEEEKALKDKEETTQL